MPATQEVFAGEKMPYYMSREDGMSPEYLTYIRKLVGMVFQSLFSTHLEAIEAPAVRPWADYENRELLREIARFSNIGAEMVDLMLKDLGMDAEALRREAESSRTAGRKLQLLTVPIESWNDGLMQRFLYSHVLLGQLPALVSSNYIRLANIAQKLMMDNCLLEWPQQVGTPHCARLERAIAEDGRDVLQAALEKWWPIAMNSFGRPGSDNEQAYIRLGIKTRTNATCRQLFLDTVTRDLKHLSLRQPGA